MMKIGGTMNPLSSLFVAFALVLVVQVASPHLLPLIVIAAVPGGFIIRRLPQAILIGLLGTLLAILVPFFILYLAAPNPLAAAIATIPDLFGITLILAGVSGAVGAGIGSELRQAIFRRPSSQEKQQEPK